MSGLKGRINKLIDRNYVFFSAAELTFVQDYFKAYLDDENTGGIDYSEICAELDSCLHAYIRDKGCDYPSRLNELAENDFLAYHAFMCHIHEHLIESCPEGIWLSDPKVIDVFFTRIRNAKRYFETRVIKA